jgi:HAD superfamily hydrolase (TIGR01509 family)
VSRLPAAVLFDMDGLLIDSERIWFAVETQVMDHLGGPWGQEHQEALVGSALDRSAQYMLDLSGRTDVGPQDVAVLLLDGMVTAIRRGPVDWMPGAQRLLSEVGAAGIPRALVSSSSRVIMDAVLAAVGSSHFDATVSGDDVERTKPDPEPYLLAAQLLEVDAAMCVALEDSPTGATSARAAGCVTVVVPSLVPVPDDVAHLQADSLERVDLQVVGDLLGSLRSA